ncbi:hypothetical protein HG536_0G01300 [Torulaspora globosa]|uniref:Transcriptional repressor OPI1 n=1 Tax=Torulaspora globosa TaxID=48254 RepID=A0A7G3ZL85_9SACH|nr:uncharacterized protein HG536_0G01300 [Torulaspora globosa]QLL34271.1 hypothetical protein HG536_0G01300 [Torulaspora globosa]
MKRGTGSSLSGRLQLSEEDVQAAEALDVLRNSHGQREHLMINVQGDRVDDKTGVPLQQSSDSLLDRVRRNSVISNVVSLYEMKSKKRTASAVSNNTEDSAKSGSDDRSSDRDDCNAFVEDEQSRKESAVSKRQKITDVIAKSKGNLKEYQLNMSIESKKRLIACLHLLKLANKQLTDRVSVLQEQVERERKNKKTNKRMKCEIQEGDAEENGDNDDDESEDEYFDAAESVDEQSKVIKMEVVGTVKKVYSLISKFAGNSLPEPARSQVRQTLLNLPTNWTISVNKSSLSRKAHRSQKHLSANGKILILAEESLNVVRNVMQVVDCSLGRAEEWVKQKQEVKELLKERFLQQQLKMQIREQIEKERQEKQA